MTDPTSLSPAHKIGQLFCIGISGPVIDNETRELLAEISPGGVCLFSRNIRGAAQTRDLLDEIRSLVPATPFLAVDQEGGLVDRLRRIMTPMPAASKIRTIVDAEELGSIIGGTLLMLGFNMDLAPVVDVIDEQRAKVTNGLFSREFGRSREEVVSLAGSFLRALQSKGCVGCLKHFPGLGASSVDSHEELPIVDLSMETLTDIDLHPYRKLIDNGDVHAIMVAHAAYPQTNLQETDKNGKLLPSSLSRNFITSLLRDWLGFDGLVITDDLEMGAIVRNYGIGDACKLAINAGSDMLAICADPAAIREGHRAVSKALETGEIASDRLRGSLSRIARLKSKLSSPPLFDDRRLTELTARVAALCARLN